MFDSYLKDKEIYERMKNNNDKNKYTDFKMDLNSLEIPISKEEINLSNIEKNYDLTNQSVKNSFIHHNLKEIDISKSKYQNSKMIDLKIPERIDYNKEMVDNLSDTIKNSDDEDNDIIQEDISNEKSINDNINDEISEEISNNKTITEELDLDEDDIEEIDSNENIKIQKESYYEDINNEKITEEFNNFHMNEDNYNKYSNNSLTPIDLIDKEKEIENNLGEFQQSDLMLLKLNSKKDIKDNSKKIIENIDNLNENLDQEIIGHTNYLRYMNEDTQNTNILKNNINESGYEDNFYISNQFKTIHNIFKTGKEYIEKEKEYKVNDNKYKEEIHRRYL